MNARKLMISFPVRGVFLKFAKLSDDEKSKVVTKVKDKLKSKKDEAPAKKEVEKPEEKEAKPEKSKGEKTPSKKDDEKPKDSTTDSESTMMSIVDGLAQEVEQIRADGQIDSSEVIGLFDNMVQMVTLLLNSKPKNVKSSMEAIAERVAARGLQVKRKDKDLMSDTGGTSKGREREPDQKPPRDDVKKPHRTKNKPADQRDKDTDNDKDMKKSAVRQAMMDFHSETIHPLDRKSEMWGMPVAEQNYYRSVWSSLVEIIMTVKGISEKSFKECDSVMVDAEQILRTADAMEMVDRFEEQNQRPAFCAESIYQRLT